ncbi:MurR/RpiR family transcriptional regulator [Mesobacterium pallidum]|uniref:MurR/RpiR family transcriptional regulator n=1 Tax=Mesobacterium pallidum TaxID=2872037 RepID=UPI001EE18DDA|nr:MurR/RpiR family transcriptional regulator [Mesobacterium pallidum]
MPKETAQPPRKAIAQRIHEAYPTLTGGERKVADTILVAPSELAVCNAFELAARAEVSNATVTRFFRRLGYESFDAARQDARRLRETGSPLFAGRPAGVRGDPVSQFLAEETRVLEATLSRVNPLTIREIAGAVTKATRIRTLGYRNSAFLAQYLAAQLAQMRPGVAPLLLPGQTESEGIAMLGPDDLAIVVGLRRRTAGFTRVVEAIAARGTPVLLIADGTIRGAPAHATWTLDCVVETPHFADSYVGTMALLRLLYIEVKREMDKAGLRHLQDIEDLRDRLGELE